MSLSPHIPDLSPQICEAPIGRPRIDFFPFNCCRGAARHALRWWVSLGWRAIHEVSRTAKEQGSIWTHQRQLRAVYARPCMLGKDGELAWDDGSSPVFVFFFFTPAVEARLFGTFLIYILDAITSHFQVVTYIPEAETSGLLNWQAF